MAGTETLLVLFLAIFSVCHGSETFDNALSNSDICSKNCSLIYKPSAGGEECERGCRFHVIGEFVLDDGNASQVNIECHDACVESYSENSTRTDACKNGCNIQQKVLEERKETDGPIYHVYSPLVRIHAVYSSFVGAFQIIRSSFITYFISGNNSVIAVESEPEYIVGINRDAVGLLPQDNDLSQDDKQQQQQQQSRFLPYDEADGEPSVVKCMSQQIGVPPYILVASVVALVVFTLYIIIAMCNTSTTTKTKGFASKNMQIDPLPLPVKLVRPEDLTKLSLTEEEDLQAPALPYKVKLPDTLI